MSAGSIDWRRTFESKFKPPWVRLNRAPHDLAFEVYPEESLEDWHRRNDLWVD